MKRLIITFFLLISLYLFPSTGNTTVQASYALINSCKFNQYNKALTAIRAGADVNYKDNEKNTPIIYVLGTRNFKLIKLLVEHNANVNVIDRTGTPLLFKAALYSSLKIFRYLLSKRINCHITDKNGNEVIHHISNSRMRETVLKLLLKKGLNINHKNKFGITALHTAALNCQTYAVKLLIKNGADVNAQAQYNFTALHQASHNGYFDIIKMLIDAGAKVNLTSDKGESVLMMACQFGFSDIVDLLIKAGADVNLRIKNYPYGYGETALIRATMKGHFHIVKKLVDSGADIKSRREIDNKGKTLLMWAAIKGCLSTSKFFIEKGINVNAQDVTGYTALHYAVQHGNYYTVKLLLKSGANTDIKNKQGVTPLQLAHSFYEHKIIKLLNQRR